MSSIVVSGDTSGAITITAPAVSGTNTLTLPAQTATLATLTTPSFATTIGVGGTTASASGAGISFPATQSASSDVNTLDDYEEGTWTPSLDGSTSGTVTAYSSRSGTYTKIGRLVQCTCGIDVSNSAGPTGSYLLLKGLPFSISNSSSGASIYYWDTFGVSAASVGLACYNSTSFAIKYVTAGATTTSTYAVASAPAAGPDFLATFTYETST